MNEHAHYQFNPRDLTQWVAGITRYSLEGLSLVEAVAHEGTRIFRDRLIGDATDKFNSIMAAVSS